jgi:glycosyltransferase involved in cell wall biosynthesis
MISVVIPAHNEERVIARCLDALIGGSNPGELEVIVVCNGCSDATADVASRYGDPVRVINTATPGKSNALAMGDEAAQGFSRFYVDADVVVTLDASRQMAERLGHGNVMAVSPAIRWNLDGASWAVRAFYDIDRRLPSHLQTIGGSGVYAVSEKGHQRLGRFPPLTADDAFVRNSFAVHERQTVKEVWSTVTPPRPWPASSPSRRAAISAIRARAPLPAVEPDRGGEHAPVLLRLAALPGFGRRSRAVFIQL